MSNPRYHFGSGKVYLAAKDSADGSALGFTWLGNVADLTLELGTTALEWASAIKDDPTSSIFLPDLTDTSLRMQAENLNPDVLPLLVQGNTLNAANGATVSNETLFGYPGQSMPLAHINLTAFTKLTDSSGATTYTPGSDYTVDLPSGMVTFPATTRIANRQALLAAYTYAAHSNTTMGDTYQSEFWLRYNGVNLAYQNNSPVVVDVFRVRLHPPKELLLINNTDITSLDIDGTVLYDPHRDATNEGRFLRIRQVS